MFSSNHLPSGNRHKQVLQPPAQSRRSTAGRRNTVDEKEDRETVLVVCRGHSFEKVDHTCDSPIKTSINCHCAASVNSNTDGNAPQKKAQSKINLNDLK